MRASAWGMLLAGKALDEVAKFAENLREELGIESMLTGMTTAHVVALCAKVVGKRRLHRRHDVPVLAMSFEGTLLRKNGPDGD